jgi:hypothetical protein
MLADKNPYWKGGIQITKPGYVYCPNDPSRWVDGKMTRIFLHRLVVERYLGRFLEKEEVVDHINGCTLDNRASNLRLFANNSAHIHNNLKGRLIYPYRHPDSEHDSSHRNRTTRGDFRAQQIALARELLPKDLFDLLRTERYTASNKKIHSDEVKQQYLPVEEIVSLLVRL